MIRFGLFTTLRFFRLFFSPIWQSHFYIATSKGGFEFMIQLVGAVPCSLGLVTKSARSSQVVPSSQSNNVLNGHFFHRSFYCPPQKQRQLQNVLRISFRCGILTEKSDDPMFKIHIEPMSAQVKGRIQDQQQCGKPTEIGPDHSKNCK